MRRKHAGYPWFSMTYPFSGRVVNYTYDSANRTTSASYGATAYATVTAFAPNNAVQQMNFSGTSLTEKTTYNSRFQPTQIAATLNSSSANLLTLAYSYCSNFAASCTNNNGNVWQQQISFASLPAVAGTSPSPAAAFNETQQYQYTDPANRLTQASAGSPWTQAFGYDSVGNRWVSSLANLPTPTSEVPTASTWFNTQNRVNGWTYDEMGSILQVLNGAAVMRSALYDAENRQTQAVVNGGAASNYVYDGDGRRVQSATANGTTTYVYDAAGRLAQEYATGSPTDVGTSYLFADHLGSTRLITDSGGGVKKRFDYLPFGEELLSGTNSRADNQGYNDAGTVGLPDKQRLKFTSKERDAETGLDYFQTRYFSSAQGRFTSADDPLADQFANDPQSWNLYSYGRNNPLRYVDPTGRKCVQTSNGQADDGTGGGCEAAGVDTNGNIQAQQVNVTAQGGNVAVAFGLNFLFAVNNIANDYFAWMFSQRPSTLQNTPNSRAFVGQVAAGTALVATALIGPEGESAQVAQIGRKLDYLLGLAKGSAHNVLRSQSMASELAKIGIADTPEMRQYLAEHLNQVLNDATNIVSREGGTEVRESLLNGPGGAVKLESIWQGDKLITVKVYGGR